MARFFQQLRLLLWKNALSVYRQPVWSLALIIWPLIIFIILAITRSKFPPVLKNACYVAPRNLPSAGFFPFLQTLLCSTDSVCANKSYEPVSPMNRMFGNSEASLRDSLLPFRSLHLDSSQKGGLVRSALKEFSDKSQIVNIWDNIINSSQEDPLNFTWTIMNVINNTVLTNQEVLMKDSVNILKKSLCTVVLSTLNSSYQSSSDPFSFALISFCNSSDTLLEAFLQTLNQVAANLLLTKPMLLLEAIGGGVLAFEQIQSDSLIWDALLGLPELFIPSSAEDKLQEVTMLLSSIKRTANTIQGNIPQINIPVSMMNMSIDAVTNILQYIQNWSSKGADVPLSDGFSMVNTESALIQKLLHPWNSEAASTDITFTTELLNNLLQIYSWSVQNSTVNPESSSQLYGGQEEKKLLGLISTLKMLEGLPGLSSLNTFLTGSHISMDLAIQILDTLREQMDFLVSEARGIQQVFGPVLPNEFQGNTWLSGLPKAIVKTIEKGSLNCSDLINQWSSQSSLPSGDPLMWELVFCNRSYLPNTLLAQWMPVVEKGTRFLELFQTPEENVINVTTILSDWKNLNSSYEQFSASLNQLYDAMNEHNWASWIQGNNTVNWLTMFLRSTNTFEMVGSELQKNPTWSVETYVYIVHWIMTFQPNITAPPNCTVERTTGVPVCQSNFTWEEVLPLTSSLMELYSNPEALLRFVQGSVAFLDAVYGDFAMQSLEQLSSNMSPESPLQSLIKLLDLYLKILSDIPSIKQLDSQPSLSILEKVLDTLCLKPLSLIWTQSFDNTSFFMNNVVQAFMNNSYMFSPFFQNLNQVSASFMELDNLIVQWLNVDGNLSRPLSFSISNALLNHSALLNASHISYLQQILKHLNNDNERDVLELVIKATEVLNQATETSHNASSLILAYLWQVQNFLASSLQVNGNESFFMLDVLKNISQMLDLHPAALEICQLNSTAFLQDLHQIGNVSILDAVLWQVMALLPEEFRYSNGELINRTHSLLRGLTLCKTSSQDCAADVSKVFLFLEQAAEMLQQSNNITNGLMTVNTNLTFGRNLTFPLVVDLLALLSPLINSTNVSLTSEAIQRVLYFLNEIPPTLNISLSSLQYGLQMSNLSLDDLVFVAKLAGSSTAQMVLTNLSSAIDAQGCFSLNNSTLQLVNSTEPHCLFKLIKEATCFFQDIPLNEDMKRLCMEMNNLTQFWQKQHGGSCNMTHFTYYDHLMSSSSDLSVILDKIHENLQNYSLESWNEVTTAIHVLKNIIQSFVNGTHPFPSINSTLPNQPEYVPEVYMDIALWYLRKLENITYTGDVSGLLYPLFRMTEMQLATSLAESQFMTSIVHGAVNLTQSIHIPLSESDLRDIKNYVISVLYEELKVTKYVAELHMNFSLAMGYNTSDVNLQMFETQIEKYLHITEDFLKDPHLISIMAEILQQNASSPDLMNMDSIWLYDIAHLLPESQFHYLSIVGQVSQALKHALLIATQEDGVQNVNFTTALMEAFSIVIGNLSTDQWPLPDIVTSDAIDVIYEALQLVLHPNMSYTEKLNLTLDILLKGESLIKVIAPNESLPILLPMTQALINYMETIIQLGGQDNWNQIITDQLQQFLPLNTTSGDMTEIIRGILDPSQGSLDEILQAVDMNNLSEIYYKVQEIGAVLFPGRQVLALSESMPALLQIIIGQADNSTWEWVEKMLEALFSSEFSALENTTSNGLILRELVVAIAHDIRTETDLVYRLGELLANLTSVHTTNSSIFEAVLSTVELVQQAAKDGLVVECADVLKMWEMALQKEEISEPNLVKWCNTSLVPLIDSYMSNGSLFAHLNITKATMAVDSLNITAADMLTELHSLYFAILNHSDIIIQLLENLSQPPTWPVVSNITGGNVSMEPFYMSNLLMPSFIKPLLDQAAEEAPWMQQYLLALEMTLNYTLQHALRSMNVTVTPDLIKGVLQIFMIGNNWTKDSIISFLHIATSENNSLADRLSLCLQMIEDWPMINNLTKPYLTAEESRLLFEKMLNLTAWWRFSKTTGMEFVSDALMKIFDIVKLSITIERNVTLPSYFDIYVKLIDNVLNMMKQLNCHGPCKSHPFTYIISFLEDLEGQLASGQTLSDLLPHAQVFRKRSKRDVETVFPEDILGLADVDYNNLLKVFSNFPRTSDIMQTIHMFFTNSDLAVILKGVSREMTGDSSFEPAINRALDMLSSVTAPGNWENYAEMLTQISQQENMGNLLDMFLKLSLQSSFEIAQNSDNISSEMSAVIKGLIVSSAWHEPQKNLTTFLVLLDQTVAAFASFMSAEQLVYFNFSTQLTKASTVLAYNPRNVEKVIQSASIISGSFSQLPTYPNEAHILSGQSAQDIYRLILNSILVTQILENLTISNYALGSMSEREHLVNEVFNQVVSTFPGDQRKYILDLNPVVLSALNNISNTSEIPHLFVNISTEVTASLLTILNLTQPAKPESLHGGLASTLFAISELVSSTLWNGLRTDSSLIHLYDAFQSLNSMATSLTSVLPPHASQYITESLHVLETEAIILNNTDMAGRKQGFFSAIMPSVEALLVGLPYPVSSIPGINLSDQAYIFKMILQLFSLDQGSFGLNDTHWIEENLHILNSTEDQIVNHLLNPVLETISTEFREALTLILQMEQMIPGISWTNENFALQLDYILAKVCDLEQLGLVQKLLQHLSITPGILCKIGATASNALQMVRKGLVEYNASFSDLMFETFIGDPNKYQISSNWISYLSQSLGFDVSSLSLDNVTVTPQAPVKLSTFFKNKTAFSTELQSLTSISPEIIDLMMNSVVPNNSLQVLSWLTNMHYCRDPSVLALNQKELPIFHALCLLTPHEWYNFAVVGTRYISLENILFEFMLQSPLSFLLALLNSLMHMLSKLLPTIDSLVQNLLSVRNLNLMANSEFRDLVIGTRASISSQATFTTLSNALCTNGILSLFGISNLPISSGSGPSTQGDTEVEQLINKFNIPRDATPFCKNLFLDMVNTTGGAVAWAFLKPMLLGQVLYTPDIPLTRQIMQEANTTLQQFADLKLFSQEWLDSSSYVMNSAKVLQKNLPVLQNSLNNPFVQRFIQFETNIDVNQMKDIFNKFSNITALLIQNKAIIQQISTLSSLMLNVSSCVRFDRFQGFNSSEELDALAGNLTQTRDLYASIIFNLPNVTASPSRKKRDSSSNPLPPRVKYTIRMPIDNVMRTDRTRNTYWVKSPYISPNQNQLYNRGFVYLQETIERAIIAMQTGTQVEEPAVQLQAFPYPCYIKDQYLNSMAFAFPLVLMIAWVLFVANFVKRLVHERELQLHEYMKMMGVNPISHFFAWFLESAVFLLVTIIILTIILKCGQVLPNSDGFLLFLYLCDYGLAILAISYLVSTFFDRTNIAGLSGSLIYIICFFPYIVIMSLETSFSFSGKSALSLFAPTCFSYASQYITRYETQGEGIQWSNSYISPMDDDTSSFGWFCWLLLIDSVLYFLIGIYIRFVFPGKYGIAVPWYFPVMPSFWMDLFGCSSGRKRGGRGLLFANIAQNNQAVFPEEKYKGESGFTSQTEEEFLGLPVGVSLHGLTKMYGDRAAIQNLNVRFYEGHVTTLLGHNGAGKTTTMSLLTGLFGPSSGSIEVYGKDMQGSINEVRKELGVCMQYDVLFDHLSTKEHLLLYGQIKGPHWTRQELKEQVRKILQETGLYNHRHKRVGSLSGGMKRKLSISIAFIGGSRLVVLDEPTTGVDPCSRRNIWDIIIHQKKERTIILSTHHLDEAEVLSDRIAFLERGGLKCCGSPFYLKDKLAQGYNLTLTKKVQANSKEKFDNERVKAFVRSYIPEARLKEGEVGDMVFMLPPFSSQNALAYRTLLSNLDSNLDALQLGCYGISDTTLEEVFLQLTKDNTQDDEGSLHSASESVLDLSTIKDSMPEELSVNSYNLDDRQTLTGSPIVRGVALIVQRVAAMLLKRVHHSRRDWKGLFAQVLLPVVFVIAAMGLGSIKSNLQYFPELELSPALYSSSQQQYSFFSNKNPNSSYLVDTMLSFPGIDNRCLSNPADPSCLKTNTYWTNSWTTSGNTSNALQSCQCSTTGQVCSFAYYAPCKTVPSSQIIYNLTGIDTEKYLLTTTNKYVRDRYGGWDFGQPLPTGLKLDINNVPQNRTLTKVWYNPEGYHTMPAYLNSLNNFILRSNLPSYKNPEQYEISVSSYPYPGQVLNEDVMVRSLVSILVVLCILTGYSIMTASFAIYEVQEHQTGSKRLQHISGIGEPMYWTINFLYDMALYLIPVVLSIAMVAAFQLPAFTAGQNLAAVTLLLLLFGFATFPWMYLLSGILKDAEMALITYICINLFISINTIISSSVVYFLWSMNNQADPSVYAVYQILSYVFLIFPQFSFGNGLMDLARMDMQVQILSAFGVDAYQSPLRMDKLGWNFISLFLQGSIFFTLRLLLNTSFLRHIRGLISTKKSVPDTSLNEDDDVVAESERVTSGAASNDLLQINHLSKVYQHMRKKVHAVKRLSVGIPAGECFGLLGVNGAGKTTTFKMLTGDLNPTDGTAQIRNWDGSMVDMIDCYRRGIQIGYCPQVDALDDLLTAEEHLYFYACIRGIARREMDQEVNHLLRRLELNYHKKKTSGSYSCGTRRKLSTAIALIGHPQILLLDEPSSGMDPRSKRHLWKVISEEVKGKCAVVLTSHSMEECEALCTRLAIMVNGQFRCLGSLQHIKHRFGSGFTVKMYLALASNNVEFITNFMQLHFPSTYLKDQHSAMVEYHVPVAPGGVAYIFDQLESNKIALQIKHFSVSQTTLDEVFINFALGKVGMESIPIHSEGSDADSLDSTEDLEN
ncbi:glucosylceramide transporter ABCA12 isoform X2 [Brienomyrus brachyistius]|uniref:glucosylceramide transporter ABCA12 isoform X2 n=1 Tax=Brienomyrus brachyistius TaxID=42636 RepID=UPI0020B1BFF8|nr:glucosylceramide transporter ABCA12 isoform X2 [Brienomyrus brachyistius]